MEVQAAKRITREAFMTDLLASQRYLSGVIEKLVAKIQEANAHYNAIDRIIWDVRQAEAEGLCVTFYETSEGQVMFMAQEKAQMGFLKGGYNDQGSSEALAEPEESC